MARKTRAATGLSSTEGFSTVATGLRQTQSTEYLKYTAQQAKRRSGVLSAERKKIAKALTEVTRSILKIKDTQARNMMRAQARDRANAAYGGMAADTGFAKEWNKNGEYSRKMFSAWARFGQQVERSRKRIKRVL